MTISNFTLWYRLLRLIGVGAGWLALTLVRAGDLPAPPVRLEAAELAYIASAGHISMCVDPDWVPFERINEQGQHEGIAADLVQLVAQRVGLTIERYPVKDWEESLAASKAKRCQIMSFLNQTPARDAWLIFTDPIFDDPNVIITREEHPFIADPHGLSSETVALPRGTMVQERIGREYPNLKLIPTGSEQESIALVSSRQADMTVRSLIVAAYTIKKEGLFNLKISGQLPDFSNRLRIGIHKDEVMLRGILNKGVQSITAQEREAIANRHVSINVQQGIDHVLVWKVTLTAALLLLLAFLWNRKLAALNQQLALLSVTDRLTGLFNRVRLDEVFALELARARRFGPPFGIVMIDVDHFKAVNDTHGHQIGDQVLVQVARLLQTNTRAVDVVGRWGGEEFMVICPQTDAQGVLQLAQKLRQQLQAHNFGLAAQQTASFGVTTYRPGDIPEDMVARADTALFKAKRLGRNQVRSS